MTHATIGSSKRGEELTFFFLIINNCYYISHRIIDSFLWIKNYKIILSFVKTEELKGRAKETGIQILIVIYYL